MKKLIVVASAALVTCGIVLAVQQDPPQMPRPGKEHELLKAFEGEWDVTTKFWMGPGEPMESKGSESCKMSLGGFWLVFDFKSEMMGQPFHGHGIQGWDMTKKKYVVVWCDSAMPILSVAWGEADKDGKVITLHADGVDPQTMKPVKEKWVQDLKDKDTHTLTFYHVGDDGKDVKKGEITYKRRK